MGTPEHVKRNISKLTGPRPPVSNKMDDDVDLERKEL
jgi:hypothetical protein